MKIIAGMSQEGSTPRSTPGSSITPPVQGNVQTDYSLIPAEIFLHHTAIHSFVFGLVFRSFGSDSKFYLSPLRPC